MPDCPEDREIMAIYEQVAGSLYMRCAYDPFTALGGACCSTFLYSVCSAEISKTT